MSVRARAITVVVIAILAAACASPAPTSRPRPSLVAPSPTARPTPTIVLTCPARAGLPAAPPMSESTCLIDQGIVVKGAAFLGFTVRTIAISPPGVDCPTFPFGAAPLNARLVVCGVDLSTVVKVTFVGTDKVAWMRLVTNGRSGQLVAIVDSFAIPLEPPQTVP